MLCSQQLLILHKFKRYINWNFFPLLRLTNMIFFFFWYFEEIVYTWNQNWCCQLRINYMTSFVDGRKGKKKKGLFFGVWLSFNIFCLLYFMLPCIIFHIWSQNQLLWAAKMKDLESKPFVVWNLLFCCMVYLKLHLV